MKQEDKIETEQLILEAAKKVFIEKGYAGARMQAIADEAQINKAMLHYYYRSKEALFSKILDSTVAIMAKQILPVLSGKGTVMEKVELLVGNYIDTITENPHIPMFVLNELAQDQVNFQEKMVAQMQNDDVFSKFMMQIMAEQKQGLLLPVAPHHFMLTVMSLIIFPFIAKPIFTGVMNIPEFMYMQMMQERKQIVIEIIKKSFVK